jgi:hypothetical protein
MIHLLQCDQHNNSNVFIRTCYGMTVIVTKTVHCRTIWTNKMHYFLLIYLEACCSSSGGSTMYKQHAEAYYWNKLTANSAYCWFILYGYIAMHCQQNLNKNCASVVTLYGRQWTFDFHKTWGMYWLVVLQWRASVVSSWRLVPCVFCRQFDRRRNSSLLPWHWKCALLATSAPVYFMSPHVPESPLVACNQLSVFCAQIHAPWTQTSAPSSGEVSAISWRQARKSCS